MKREETSLSVLKQAAPIREQVVSNLRRAIIDGQFQPGERLIERELCEAPGCSQPGTICPACLQCFCFHHLQRSSCEDCNRIVSHRSFEHQLGRLVSIGFSVLLCGLLFLLLPRDSDGMVIQLAFTLIVVGALLIWFGFLART